MGRAFQNRKESMAKTAGQKTKVYSKYGKEIYMCAKDGGTDPDHNLSLRRLIEKAKKDQVPTHVIERAIEKTNSSAGEDYAPARYEGFAPGGVMIIVDCLTDNSNRTFTQIRQAFVKNGAKLGGPGAVSHMFDHQAVFAFKGDNEDEVLEMLMMEDIDVTDIEEEDGMLSVFAPTTEFYKIKTALNKEIPDLVLEVEEITFVPQTMHQVTGDDVAIFNQFIEALNDCDDTQEVYHNAEIID